MKKYAGVDLVNFNPINNPVVQYEYNPNNFVRIPNYLIQNNILETYNVHRIMLTVYCLIEKQRNPLDDTSWLIISKIFDLHKLKVRRDKPAIFYEIIKCLIFLSRSNMIEIISDFDINKISYNTFIHIRILNRNFDACDNFTKLTFNEFDFIMNSKSKVSKENLLAVFLYAKSFMFSNSKKKFNSFFSSIENIRKTLNISNETIDNCLDALILPVENMSPLLIKHDVGSIIDPKTKTPKNIPNIYVLNKAGYEEEIKRTLEYLKQEYQVKKFFKKCGNYD